MVRAHRAGLYTGSIVVACLAVLTSCSLNIKGNPLGANNGLIEYPGKNPGATRAYLRSLDFSQKDSIVDASIPCHDAADCAGGSIHLRIVPELNAYKVPVDEALKSGRGYIVARIENKSQAVYKSLNLSPNEVAYLWVGEMPSGPRRIGIFHINEDNGHATWRSTASQAGWCPARQGLARTVSAVHLNPMPECVTTNSFYSSPMQGIGMSDIYVASTSSSIIADAMRKPMVHTSGLWFSCSLGCCEGTGFLAALT
jgi:hypothetical protein